MKGSHLADEAGQRSLVEIRVVPSGQWPRPPSATGMPDGLNPLLSDAVPGPEVGGATVGGMGLNSSQSDAGMFCLVLPQRPSGDIWIFARAYNAPTINDASFYADSQPVQIPGRAPSVVLTFSDIQPLDSNDDDNDGLNNSWEKSLGTDPSLIDTDGDGYSDHVEWLAGTDPLDPDSYPHLMFTQVIPLTPSQVLALGEEGEAFVNVRWRALPGQTYRLEYATSLGEDTSTNEPYGFEEIQVVTAGEDEFEIDVNVVVDGHPTGVFRVWRLPEEE